MLAVGRRERVVFAGEMGSCFNGNANRNDPAEWNRRERRTIGERRLEGMECSGQEQGLALHRSTDSSSVVNTGRQRMSADARKWVDVEGIRRNSYCLKCLSRVARKSAGRADRKERVEVSLGELV